MEIIIVSGCKYNYQSFSIKGEVYATDISCTH